MSGVLKAVGKAFRKVAKVAKVVLPIALAVGAVVFTGGAALGVLLTFSAAIGGVVGSLGLSTTLAGALTGAVVSAGFGSAVGGVTAAAGGKNVLKGMQAGAATGAVTGGALGAVSPATFGIQSAASTATTGATNGLVPRAADAIAAPTGLGQTGSVAAMGGTGVAVPGVAATAAPAIAAPSLGVATSAVSPALTAPALTATAPVAVGGSTGLLSFANNNPTLAGSLISGVAKGIGGSGGDGRTYADQTKAQQDSSGFAYGGAYAGQSDPFGLKPIATPNITPAYAAPGGKRWQYDAKTNSIVEVGA